MKSIFLKFLSVVFVLFGIESCSQQNQTATEFYKDVKYVRIASYGLSIAKVYFDEKISFR